MKILSKYLIKEFIRPLVLVIMAFMCIIMISEFFDRLDTLIKFKPGIVLTLKYFSLRIPEWLVLIMPLSILLATLFSLSNLSQNNEISAMKASGVSLLQITRPIMLLALLSVVMLITFNELIVPFSNKQANYTYNTLIKKQPFHENYMQYNIVVTGAARRKYTIGILDIRNKLIKNFTIDELSPELSLMRQIYSKEAKWNDFVSHYNKIFFGRKYHWILSDGVIRDFDNTGKKVLKEELFSKKDFFLPESIEDLCSIPENLKHLSYFELKKYVVKLIKNGIPSHRERVELYSRIAYPFSCFIVALLGIPFAFNSPKSPRAVSFALAIFIIFIFWGIISVGQSLGESKVLPPFIAAWFANIIFGILAMVLLWKTRRY